VSIDTSKVVQRAKDLPNPEAKPTKNSTMDGENHGKAYFLMDDLGGKLPLFSETPIYQSHGWNQLPNGPLSK